MVLARKTIWLLPACAVALGAAVLWHVAQPSDAPTEPSANAQLSKAEAERAATQAAVELIAAEQTDEHTADAPLVAQAPPGMTQYAGPADDAPPTPPDGYSFTKFHGKMAKASMTAQDYEDAQDGADERAPHQWLLAHDALAGLLRQAADAGRDWTFGWVGAAPGAQHGDLVRAVEARGAKVLGRSATLLRARLPADRARLAEIASLADVAGVAPTPARAKLPPSLAPGGSMRRGGEPVPTFVTLMADDASGRWRRALAELGATVGRYTPDIRVVEANIPDAAIAAVAAADFVLAVEPVRHVEAALDSAAPVMGADALRLYDDGTRLFTGTGGASVPVGVMDTGLNISHMDIATGRNSICGANTVPFFSDRDEDLDLWFDIGLHGTHVTGTILGNGAADPRYAGMAPLVRDIRFAKVLGLAGGSDITVSRGMDFLARPTACGGGAAFKPLIVNASLGVSGEEWRGRSVSERKLDAVVWNARQLYVVAQSNDGHREFGNFSGSKNSLAVGAAYDSGDIATFSSHGPTADGRLAPQIVGAGVSVQAPLGNGAREGLVNFSGTSMSSPAVAGVAALLMDAVPGLREQPAAVRARLMASAIRPDAFLDDFQSFPLHNGGGPGRLQHRYGLGKVSARTSVLSRDQADGWTSGSAVADLGSGEYAYQDIEVPAGASRLDIVMTWDEPAAETLVAPVQNDLDLWVDRDVCQNAQTAACGNAASRSTKDNVEWLILRNPQPGTYRLKVVPKRTYGAAPRAALAWTVIRGPSTPSLSIGVASATVSTAPGRSFEVEATLAASGYVAAGTQLRVDCRGADGSAVCERLEFVALKASDASREDGVARSLAGDSGDAISLGELAVGEEQRVKLVFRSFPDAERFRVFLTATAWNASSATTSVAVAVGESDAAEVPAAARPANDDFANAERLLGVLGDTEFDLLLATPEPGEPPYRGGPYDATERPRSVWYVWTAPTTETYRFGIAQDAVGGIADAVQIDLFQRDPSLSLVAMRSDAAKVGGGLTLAAEMRETYYIRVSIARTALYEYEQLNVPPEFASLFQPRAIRRRAVGALSLRWSRGPRPENDDFEMAAPLEGESGELAGSNIGATLQTGEYLGGMAATTWHRWTAPADGDWRFEVNRANLRTLAFHGADVSGLRLASGMPATAAVFPARAGEEYRIAVAASDAVVSGSDYALRWMSAERAGPDNDDIATAEVLLGLPSYFHASGPNLAAATVQPGEPAETGSRTVWWTWTAPLDGTFTWRFEASYLPVQFTVFAGEAAEELELVAATGADVRSKMELAFTAAAGQRYWIAAGLIPDSAFVWAAETGILMNWGPTPANDSRDAAEMLAGMSGSVSGSSLFATLEPGETAGILGDSSLWYVWEAPDAGWFRFALDDLGRTGVVVVYRVADDGSPIDSHHLATSRRLSPNHADAIFEAEAGVRYAIRVSHTFNAGGSDFLLAWEEHGAPSWLRYAGSVADSDIDADGRLIELGNPRSMALRADGGALYVATAHGLQAFSRDASTGALRRVQTLPGVDGGDLLLWDARSDSLLVGSCAGWQRFPSGSGAQLADAVALQGVAPCPGDAVFRDSSGSFVHIVRRDWALETYRLDDDRAAIEFLDGIMAFGLQAAAMSADDDLVYLAAFNALRVYERDAETGLLELFEPEGEEDDDGFGLPSATPIPGFAGDVRMLALDDGGRYLLAFGNGGRETHAFVLADGEMPEHVASLAAFGPDVDVFRFFGQFCTFADMRQETLSADVFCATSAYVVRLLPETGELRAEDFLYGGGADGVPDAFGNLMPPFTGTGHAAVSPDGRHIYAATDAGLLIFERAPSR